MDCTWDAELLQRGDQLPTELLHIIQSGSNEQYLRGITKASLDARYTPLLFTHCENLFAHICASLRDHGSLASAIATLGRIVPFAPYLAPYATHLLENERLDLSSNDSDETLLYMLGIFRLLRFDHATFRRIVDMAQVHLLLRHQSRPVVYLAIRIIQYELECADHWFESMIMQHLGEDTPESNMNGQWDDKAIDYRFLTLWEEQREENMMGLVRSIRSEYAQPVNGKRFISEDCFHPSAALVGGILLPRLHAAMPINPSHLIRTSTITNNIRQIAAALKVSRPLLLSGLPGSGKTLLVRHVAEQLGKLDKLVTLHLNEQSDAKLLVGIYTTGDTPGSFVWQPGVLTTAVQEGRWILIEDLDRAPNDVLGTLLPLIERRELLIPNRKQTIHAAPGFRIMATVRTNVNHRAEQTRPLGHMVGARHWQNVEICMPPSSEQREIAFQLFPTLSQLLPQLMAVFDRLQASRQHAVLIGQSKTGVLRAINPRDLLKWCSRITKLLHQRSSFTSSDMDDIFMEAIDCFVGALPDSPARSSMAATIAEELRIDPQRRDYLRRERDVRYQVDKARITVGRYSLPRAPIHRAASAGQSTFSANPHTSRMLERVAAAVINHEPLLLVGETGVGKTTAVQHLVSHLGKKLEPFNLSQQSEAGDLLGGFKPVTARSLIVPMKDEFDGLFEASFSISKNQHFLELLGKQMVKSNWKAVCKLWQQALKMVDQQRAASPSHGDEAPSKKRKLDSAKVIDFTRWASFAAKVTDMDRRLTVGTEAFAFSFIEGNIVRAVRNGDWVLLDEINLASPDTLEALADLFDPTPSLTLTEAGSVERIKAHPEFRIFAAMNPATDVGKKDLPPGIRSLFTELYVESPDKDIKSLQSIVRSYLRSESTADPSVALDISTLYQKVIGLSEQNKLVDGAGQKPHFSLRTLTRTLNYAKYIAPQCNLRRALYEGFQMSFLTFLDAESAKIVQPLLEQYLLSKRTNVRAELQRALRKPNDGRAYIQAYPGSKHWARQGSLDSEEQPQYILTPFIRTNLENLVRASSTRQFPVLIQGPTSSGKTSMIEYLAKRTRHKFVRINNHEHTDLQEYLGTYISGADGSLQFQEGVLVQALREGHWIVLDELNLAPTDVLEALNRLLDDNRELLIPETQEVVRPHSDFMLFATQNPAGMYGGRKTLSRAFRNRFLELHFDDIPIDELQEILHRRTELPESRCKRIVAAYREFSVLRQESRLFEEKSFATLRDLFRWALRPNDTIEQLAENGFMLLAERVRNPEERLALKAVIEKVMSANGPRVTLDADALYASDSPEIQAFERAALSSGVVWTRAMRRLYVLVSRAIQNNEPVLLAGETGCGKTTVCQMLADALGKRLHTVNAHQNTETGDLIGSQRPVRNRAAIEAELRQRLLASPALQSLESPAAHSSAVLLVEHDKAVLSLEESDRKAYQCTLEYNDIHALRTRHKALFEWIDGSLVQAMRQGDFFLLDEISLADDSVLERLNSVLETQRTILLAEKGSLDTFVSAAAGFQFFATMNPGGDYGKRELSPALRNRFTEIWVPALSDSEDIALIVQAKLVESARPYADAIVAFAQWFKDRYNTSASSSVSVRDALSWAQFVNAYSSADVIGAIVHGAAMVYIDTLGANPAGLMTVTARSLDEERSACLAELGSLMQADAATIYAASAEVVKTNAALSIGPFAIPTRRAGTELPTNFTFEARTTRTNAMRVMRAMQLPKAVMLEGSPGVGKTALVTAIAEAAGVPLTRINLSEQTDLIDLFGSDAPVEGADTGTFAWRDASFLRAVKNGEWVLLDEMNLASQSVLEGLNACLDHRGEVFVPELGQTFVKHADFRLFAAQNPHHQGGGRKGLPASFVNRFTVVYADMFRPDDLSLICRRSFPQIDATLFETAIRFVERLDTEVQHRRFGANGGPWEFNLRDISRWLALHTCDKGLVPAGTAKDFVRLLFTQRFRTAPDRAFIEQLFESVFGDSLTVSDLFSSISTTDLQLGLALMGRDTMLAKPSASSARFGRSHEQLRILESAMLCVQQGWPVILTGPSGSGKTALIGGLAAAMGAPLATMALNAETDAMDLVGGYEQADPLRASLQLLEELRLHFVHAVKADLVQGTSSGMAGLVSQIERSPQVVLQDPVLLARVLAAAEREPSACHLADAIRTLGPSLGAIDKARFEWSDGLLVEALEKGKWLVLDNANLCSSSVLDRLNSLLEPDGALIINEHTEPDGSPRIIRPHPRFRVFLTVDPRYGELSRAMRNRAVELYLPAIGDADVHLQPLQPESSMTRFRHFKALSDLDPEPGHLTLTRVVTDHLGLRDRPLASRFQARLDGALYSIVADPSPAVTTSSIESSLELLDFYKSATSHAEASADSARVQTLHPLNNQALVQRNQHLFTQASTLALKHDFQIQLLSVAEQIASLQSNQSTMRQLERVERVAFGSRKSSGRAGVVQSIKLAAEACLHWLRGVDVVALHDQHKLKKVLLLLCAYWQFLLIRMANHRHDPASLNAWLSAMRALLGNLVYVPEASRPMLHAVSGEFTSTTNPSTDSTGHAMIVFWKALKPRMPKTMQQLHGVFDLERIVARFDQVAQQFELPVSSAADMRSSFARAVNTATASTADVTVLSRDLEALMTATPGTSNVELPARRPHFADVFERLSRHAAMLALADLSIPSRQVAAIETLALRSTPASMLTVDNASGSRAQRDLRLLSGMLGASSASTENDTTDTLPSHVLAHTSSVQQVSLRDLSLLESETDVLGQVVGTHAHTFNFSELNALDACLERMLRAVLSILQQLSNDGVQNIVRIALEQMETGGEAEQSANSSEAYLASNNNKALMDVHRAFKVVARYLGSRPSGQHHNHQQAAEAWAAFATTCLTLYVPQEQFDPILQPQLERDIHRQCKDSLQSQVSALQAFRTALSGEAHSLRATVLRQDIVELGPEPEAEDMCRPEVSQLSELQKDSDALMRAILPLREESNATTISDPLLWANIDRIRSRLSTHHRPYGDVTGPVVGFVDCLRVAGHLARAAQSQAKHSTSYNVLDMVPFHNAYTQAWASDETFIACLSTQLSEEKRLLALSALAARSSVSPLQHASIELQDAVDQQFSRFYNHWQTTLGEAQRRATADSSFYRYKGDEDVSDDASTEELDALFPDLSDETQCDRAQEQRRATDPVAISSIYRGIMRSSALEESTLLHLLKESVASMVQDHRQTEPSGQLPALIWSLRSLSDHLSEDALRPRAYNIYTDANVVQVRHASRTLVRIRRRFEDLRSTWPDHATPVEVLRMTERIFSTPHTEPLTKYLPLFEQLRSTIAQWQNIASRQYSVADLLEEITSLIVSWRQLELSSWAGLLDREDVACQEQATSWWFIAYESIIAAGSPAQTTQSDARQHAQDLLKTLEGFIDSCGLGEFLPRLEMLRDFEAHLATMAHRQPAIASLHYALANFISYYQRFGLGITEKLSKGRAALEKEIKDVIQLASWKDRNIDVLKQSALTSRKKLLKVVRKYRNLLARPVGPELIGAVADLSPSAALATSSPLAQSDAPKATSHSSLPAWLNRPARFVNIDATVSMIRAKESHTDATDSISQLVVDFAKGLLEDIVELQKETPSTSADDNKSHIQDLKRRKRRLLAHVIREVQHMGYQRNLSEDVLAKQAGLHMVLSSIPALAAHANTAGVSQAEYHFHRLLSVLPAVREAARKHSEDLTPAEAARCMALLESMLQNNIVHRTHIASRLEESAELQSVVQRFSAFAACDTPIVKPQDRRNISEQTRLGYLGPMIRTSVELLHAQAHLAGLDFTSISSPLKVHAEQVRQVLDKFDAQPPLPCSLADGRSVMVHERANEISAGLGTTISSAIQGHPETEPILSQLAKWIVSDSFKPSQKNGLVVIDGNTWITRLLQAVDGMLAIIQDAEPTNAIHSERGWLTQQGSAQSERTQNMRVVSITQRLSDVLEDLQHAGADDEDTLASMAAACATLQPIIYAYKAIYDSELGQAVSLHRSKTLLAHQLATSFLQLAQHGFCTPPEKADGKDQKAGEVESGTGLGEGEGGQDISKDIGDEEDLSELAQDGPTDSKDKDLADEQDAVDMADQEMKGEIGDGPEGSEAGEGDSDDNAEAQDPIEEEKGSVDDRGPSAVDEKMWDEGPSKEQQDKQAEDAKGIGADENAAAAQEDRTASDKQEADGNEDDEFAEAVNEDEHVQQQNTEQLDPHTAEQENLDLPEDITMGGNDAEEAPGSDDDAFSELPDDEDEAGQEAEQEADGGQADDEIMQDDLDEEPTVGKDAENEQEKEEGGDDAASDLLMKDEDREQTDTGEEETVFGETGSGGDAEQPQAQQASKSSALQETATESGAARDEDSEADATGAEKSGKTQKGSLSADRTEDGQSRLPYKQIGEVLDEWYRQHAQIEAAQDNGDDPGPQPEDVDMADTRFEHLLDQDAAADTQALGAASAEQSTALDEDSGLPVNDQEDNMSPPYEEDDVAHPPEDAQQADGGLQVEPSDMLQPERRSNAFVGESQADDIEMDVSDELLVEEEKDVEDVDKQLTDTHIDDGEVAEDLSLEEARRLWSEHEASTRNLSLVLTEHLRLVLQPTQATKMRGDFRTGKRLNIKRIIPYIASSYKRDKIWMRRSVPSKRSYQVMLAIDDSKSMAESESKQLAFETVSLVAKAMSMLEVGELSVVSFGEDVKIAHDFSMPWTSEAGAQVFKQFTFAQTSTNVRKLLAESVEMFRSARLKAAGSASDLWQLQLIISDGVCQDHPSIRQLVRQAHEERIMVVFIIIDAAAQQAQAAGGPKQSILDLQTAEFAKDQAGEMQLKMVKYLDTFPFRYYLIVRDVQELPGVLAGALRQWFAEVVETAG